MKVGVGIQGWGKFSGTLWWLDPDVVLFMQDGLRELRWLRANDWKGEAWFRFYDGNSMGSNPENYAQRVYDWLVENDNVQISDVILWNELNLGLEHNDSAAKWDTPEAYEAINGWTLRCIIAFQQLVRGSYKIHWGALSPGPESEMEIMAQSMRAADVVDIHAYGPMSDEWNGTGQAKRIVAKLNSLGIPTERIAITETNEVIYTELCEWLKRELPDLNTVVWFLFCAEDPQHSEWDLVRQDLELLREFIIHNKEVPMARFQIGNKWYDSLIEQLPVRVGVEGYQRRELSDIEEITIHHSGSDTYATTSMSLATDMVQHDDPNRTKYPETPYHIVVEPDGHVIVCQPLDALTWHADGEERRDGVGINNWHGVGICLMGDFSHHPPSGPQIAALSELCPEIDFAMGKKLRRVRHSDVQATLCPGETSRGIDNWFDALFSDIAPPVIDKMVQIRNHAQAIIDLTS